jgi:hypothetical protein
MILLNNPYKTIAPLILVLVLLIPSLSQAAPDPPSIVSFSPTVGSIGTVVTLTGTNFSSTPTNNIVYFGATKATVTAATATQLTVTVPTGATYAPITVLNTLTGLLAYSNSNFTPTFTPNKGEITSSDFSAKVDFTPGLNPFSVAIADLDDDGKADLAVTNYGSNSVSVFRNTSSIGSVSYAAKIDHTTDSAPLSVATGDLDGDGKADLAVTNGNTVSVFRNTCSSGIISFATKVDISSTNPTSVAIGDLDGDGKADIVVTNENSNTVSVFRNTGSSGVISFAAQVVFTAGTTPISVAIGDFNGDGKADLVVANVNSNTVSVFRNTGNTGIISYAAKEDLAVATNPYSVAIGDLDGDGKADLAVANFSSNIVSVFRNNGSSGTISYAPKVDFITGDNPYLVRIGDLNGDGKPDLVVANYASNTVSVFRNTVSTGIISYAAKVDLATGSTPNSVGIGDLDGDGRADLAVANYNGSTVSIIRNNPVFVSPPTITSFTPTSGGTGTAITFTGTNFTGATAVSFGGTAATSFTVVSATSIIAVIANGASGTVSVTTPGGIATLAGFTFITPPIITGFTPNVGIFGTSVTITGTNFGVPPTNNIIKFNGTTATIISNTSTSITTTVPVGATTGPITVTVNGQTATSGTNFTVIFPPTITSFTPASGIIGAQVTITGTNFSITPANNIVKFNGTTATITGTPTATSITTTVPTGATTGKITVEVDGRTATSTTNFYIGSVSRLGRFVVDKTSGCAPLTVTILDANLVTSGECTLGKPCFMNAGSGGSQQTNQFTFNYTQAGTYTLSVNYQTIGADDITITVNAPTITLSPSSTICSGTFTNLIASGASTYSWSPALGLSTTTEGSVIARPTTTTIYVVIGTDTNGCTQSKSVTVTVNNPCVIPNLANGKGLDSYRIFSIPLKLSDKKIETVLASVMQYYGGYDQDKWRLVHYSNGNNLNFTQGLSTIEEGKGYWLLSVDPLTINVSGTVLPVNQSTPFIMNLDKGWNQIGNPFGFDILWSDVLSKNSNTTSVGELYVYNPATISFIKSDKLPAWGGGFVNTTAVSSLTIPIAVKQATGGRLSTSAESVGNQIDQPAWFVPLKLQQGEAINDLGGIGMHDEALIGRDKYDENSLPRFVKFLELNSYHDEYFQTRFMRDVVPSTSNYNWNLYVESNFGEGDVKLSWEYETFSRNNAQLLLYDKQAKVIIDMKKVGEYKFGSPSTRELTIMYAIDEKHLSTESLTLGLPFPNPLVLETTIPFITRADEILINVYDMLGRKVKEVARSNFETGYHEIVWQGDDYLGEHVSPGMYIIRVSGSNSPAAAVRILVK